LLRNPLLDLVCDLLCRTGDLPMPAIHVLGGGNLDHVICRVEGKVDGPVHSFGVNLHLPSYVPLDAVSC